MISHNGHDIVIYPDYASESHNNIAIPSYLTVQECCTSFDIFTPPSLIINCFTYINYEHYECYEHGVSQVTW